MTNTKNTIALLLALLAGPLHAEAIPATDTDTPSVVTTTTSEAVIAVGDSLDRVLARSGILPANRLEAALALEGVYDLRDLRPGDLLRWTT